MMIPSSRRVASSLLVLGALAATADGFGSLPPRFNPPKIKAECGQAVARALVAFSLCTGLVAPPSVANVHLSPAAMAAPAGAGKLNSASSAGSRVNKDAESLLRYALPISNKEVRELQSSVEDVKNQIPIRQWAAGINDVKAATATAKNKASKILAAVPSERRAAAEARLGKLQETLDKLGEELAADGSGEVKGAAKLSKCYALQDEAAAAVGEIEELMIPVGYHVSVPSDYKGLPYLDGRAVAHFEFVKAGKGEKFDVDGNLYEKVAMDMVIDGYNAPLTAGNFVELINKDFYKNMEIDRSDGFVVQTGAPKATADDPLRNGYIPPGKDEARRIPLEISLVGEKDPLYGLTVDDDGRGGAASRLPFQSTGALGMARAEYDNDSASSQFFWLLFESDLTPAGKNMMDGRYSCFGYVTKGAEFLKDIKQGDIISEAKVVSGGENLKTV